MFNVSETGCVFCSLCVVHIVAHAAFVQAGLNIVLYYLSVCLSVFLSVCLSVCVCVCLSQSVVLNTSTCCTPSCTSKTSQ